MDDSDRRQEVGAAFSSLSDKIYQINEFEYQVIVLCSFLDRELSQLLDAHLREPLNKDSKLDFTLSEKITLCYQLGFFEKEICVVYDQLRKLRNEYSHQIDADTQKITSHLKNILDGDGLVATAIKEMWEKTIAPEIRDNFNIPNESVNQVKFLTICMFHIAGLKWAKADLV